MKRLYCTQNDGNCQTCSLVNYGRDCRNNPVYDPKKDTCDSCGFPAYKCNCGDFVSTWPISPEEEAIIDQNQPVITKKMISDFFGE